MNTKYAPQWFEGWKNKYSNLLVEGLTDGPTYVRLVRKECPMLDVQLALRPFVVRVSEESVAIMAKLSVFPVKESVKAEPANAQVMISWLASAFPNLEFTKRDEKRVGTVIAALIDAPLAEKKTALAHWTDSDMVDRMLDWIEESGACAVEDRKGAARALKEAYQHWLEDTYPKTKGIDGAGLVGGTDNILMFEKKDSDAGEPEA